MNITVLAVAVAVCLCVTECTPDGRITRKQQRPTRGFKNLEMMTARGFGKRARTERDVEHQPSERSNRGTPTFKSPSIGIARDFGKRTLELDSEGIKLTLVGVPVAERPTNCCCDEHEHVTHKYSHKNRPLMVAIDYGKRSGNDEVNEEEEEIRVTRGTFKPNSNVLIARGYGKRMAKTGEYPEDEVRVTRGSFKPNSNVLIARGYGKRQENGVYGMDNFWENLESSQEKDGSEGNEEKTLESIPLDWFVNEMINNPEFARSVVRKFIDLNQDDMLSSEELLRSV